MRGLVGGYGIGSRPLGWVKCRNVRRRRRHVVTCVPSRLKPRAVRLSPQGKRLDGGDGTLEALCRDEPVARREGQAGRVGWSPTNPRYRLKNQTIIELLEIVGGQVREEGECGRELVSRPHAASKPGQAGRGRRPRSSGRLSSGTLSCNNTRVNGAWGTDRTNARVRDRVAAWRGANEWLENQELWARENPRAFDSLFVPYLLRQRRHIRRFLLRRFGVKVNYHSRIGGSDGRGNLPGLFGEQYVAVPERFPLRFWCCPEDYGLFRWYTAWGAPASPRR